MHLPRPVRNRNTKKDLEAASKQATEAQPPTSDIPIPTTDTGLTPAMSAKMKEAIEALLMLGDLPTVENNPLPADDNALLVPITGTAPDDTQDASLATNDIEPNPTDRGVEPTVHAPGNPPPGMVLGTATKTDGEKDNDTQEEKL